ncbi:anti-sigma factor [Bacteroidia bacterium]|nr:anti-sigma factor [Bacteroidia bacterium]
MDELIRKYYQGELTPEERINLLRKAKSDEELKGKLISFQNLQALLEVAPLPSDREIAKKNLEAFICNRKNGSRRQVIRRILQYAAMAACLIGATWLFAVHHFSANGEKVATLNTLYVPAGQRVSFTLADGTLVWLNAQTKLTYPVEFSADERHVHIEGEAYFEVAKDKKKPFVVSSKDADIKVLGTTFNISAYPEEPFSRISLQEGSLLVYNPQSSSEGIKLKPNEEVTIEGNRMKVSAIKDNNYSLWKDGVYCFEDELFGNVLKKLEIYYDVSIEVKEPSMLQWRYTVKFRQRDGIHEILRLMQRIHQFTIIKDDENNHIVIKK